MNAPGDALSTKNPQEKYPADFFIKQKHKRTSLGPTGYACLDTSAVKEKRTTVRLYAPPCHSSYLQKVPLE
jgi:hypothetical protein